MGIYKSMPYFIVWQLYQDFCILVKLKNSTLENNIPLQPCGEKAAKVTDKLSMYLITSMEACTF